MTEAELLSDNERLRAEVEAYKQRELADLRNSLAAAWKAADSYQQDALHNAEAGRQIYATAQETIATLRAQLEALRTTEANRIRGNANR